MKKLTRSVEPWLFRDSSRLSNKTVPAAATKTEDQIEQYVQKVNQLHD